MSSLFGRASFQRGRQNGDRAVDGPKGFNELKIPLDVVVVSMDADGFLNREELRVEAVFNQPLKESLRQVAPMLTKSTGSPEARDGDNCLEMACFEGNYHGKEIDLDEWPMDVEYIKSTLSKEMVPLLFISNREMDSESRNSSSASEDSQRQRYRNHIIRRKESAYIQRVLHTDSSSTQNTEGSRASGEQGSSFSVREVSLTGDSDEHTNLHSNYLDEFPEEMENDDVFPLDHWKQHYLSQNQLQKSATVGRNLVPSASLLDLSHLSPLASKTSVTLRRPLQSDVQKVDGHKQRKTESEYYLSDFQVSVGELRRKSEGLETMVEPAKLRSVELMKRRGAMKRRSTLDMEHHTCSLRMCTVVEGQANGWSEVIHCTNYTTVGELKQDASRKLAQQGQLTKDGAIHTLTLAYSWEGKVYELYNNSQILLFRLDTAFYKRLVPSDEENPPTVNVILGSTVSRKELSVLARITKLTDVLLDKRVEGFDNFRNLTRIQAPDLPEVQSARRSLHDLVVDVADERDNELYALSPDVLTTAIPSMLTLKVPYTNRLPVTFHYFDEFTFTREVNINYSAEAVLSEIYPCLVACKLISKEVEAYVLQVTGEESYIYGKVELVAFKDIRRSIAKNEPIHLSVVEKPSLELYRKFDFSWLPLDPNSNYQPLHSQVSSDFRNISESVWECNSPFTLKVVRGENLPFSCSGEVLVELSLHVGTKTLHGAKRTNWIVQDSYTITWNQELEFITKLKNIPKAAKLLVIVRQARNKDSDNKNRTFYWGLLRIFDHRGMLHTGDHVVYLWEAKLPRDDRKMNVVKTPIIDLKEGVDYCEKFNSMLGGPVANNPNSKAVRVVINFGNPDKPVYFPSTGEDSRQSLFKHHPSIRNVGIRRYFEKFHRIFFMDRPTEKKLYHALPRHLLLINWSDFTECLEVYSLLETLRQDIHRIPLYVALQLLDSDFHDENIRAFAVEVLEKKLLDENLEDYVLQLTQALKFEPYHDSPLARFLLRKALNNKKIGHFFFWYLKSEMYDAQYMPRFAVILEAYLKGCGEAMLTNFVDQVDLQNALEATSDELKREFGKDGAKMQDALPGLLKANKVTKFRFISPYSHRFKFGDLRIEKCKVMSSAKKPLWLEFVNLTPSSLNLTPIRLIYKTGDDLRQDVITLRMFSLFEKLWENEGLDLKLIPYGCLATSKSTGFIEVVKNAKTISEVSGISENQKRRLYQWIESHQKNEYGEIDQDKVKAAVNTFMRSCAGYSVATYTLGIGDRHNDNIMVTTSGNLFHIDFGHFLGNIKYFKGIRREWAPFVLTPDFVHVLGGEQSATFQAYKNLCCRAFLILRRHADLIISLFALMRSTGIPELACVDDIDYIRTALVLEEPDSKAEGKFLDVIQQCLDLKWTVQLSWIAHNLKHRTSS